MRLAARGLRAEGGVIIPLEPEHVEPVRERASAVLRDAALVTVLLTVVLMVVAAARAAG